MKLRLKTTLIYLLVVGGGIMGSFFAIVYFIMFLIQTVPHFLEALPLPVIQILLMILSFVVFFIVVVSPVFALFALMQFYRNIEYNVPIFGKIAAKILRK